MAQEQCLRYSDFQGARLKKALRLKRAIKTYHNPHRDRSGNFGFVLVKAAPDKPRGEDWYTLSGEHDTEGCITLLRAGDYASAASQLTISSYTETLKRIEERLRRETGN